MWRKKKAGLAIRISGNRRQHDLARECFRGRREFTNPVAGDASIGLQRGRKGEMRGEGVVDVGDAPRERIVGNDLGGADAADAAAIDLDEPTWP